MTNSTLCGSDTVNINYEFNDTLYSFHSEPYALGRQFYEINLTQLSVFGSYPFTECLSVSSIDFNATNVTNSISLIVTAPRCTDDIAIINKLSEQGSSGIILYTENNETDTQTTATPHKIYARDILEIQCEIRVNNGDNDEIKNELTPALRAAISTLLESDTTVSNATETIFGLEYDITVDISQKISKYSGFSESKFFYAMLAKGIKSYIFSENPDWKRKGIVVTILEILQSQDYPTLAPTPAPTIQPTPSPTHTTLFNNIPVRRINSYSNSANQFIERAIGNDILVSFDCNSLSPTAAPISVEPTPSPSNIPSISPTPSPNAANQTDDDTVLLYFFDENVDLQFQFLLDSHTRHTDTTGNMEYIYDFCDWNDDFEIDPISDIIVDTIFERPKYVCIKYKGTVLKLNKFEDINANSSSFQAKLESDIFTDCTAQAINSSFIDLERIVYNDTDTDTNDDFNSIGTYCTKIVSIGGGEYEFKYKKLYTLVDQTMSITDSTFEYNEIDYGNGSAITVSSDESHNDYIRLLFENVLFDSNVNNHINGSGGAFHRIFGHAQDDGYDYIGGLDFLSVNWTNNAAYFGGALSIQQLIDATSFDGNVFKSLITIKNNIFAHNHALFGGGALFIEGGNTFLIDSLFENNAANHSGGAVYIASSSSGMTLLDTIINSNTADYGNGGGLFNTDGVTNNQLITCLGFYNVNFTKNVAKQSGGAFYLNIVGSEQNSDSDTGEDSGTCLKVVSNGFSGNNDTEGNQVFLSLTGGELAAFIVAEWCSGDTSVCEAFTTSVVYLCMQKDSIEDGVCDELQKQLISENKQDRQICNPTCTTYENHDWIKLNLRDKATNNKRFQPLLYLNPGASVILEIYGWDNFANPITTDKYDVLLNDTSPVTFTSKASKFDMSAYVLPLFVAKGSDGQEGTGALIDPTSTVEILPKARVIVVPCDPGYFQQEDIHDDELFTCTRCVYGRYSMATDDCKECEIGMKCMGANQTYMLSGYYGELVDEVSGPEQNGGIYTQLCPEGFCCSSPVDYPGITLGCLFDPLGITNEIDPQLLCGSGTNRNWRVPLCGDCLPGYSETSSKVGVCLVCEDSNGLWGTLLPNILFGSGLIGFYMFKGLKPADIDHPFIVYTTKSALYVFQLLPYLTFQSTVAIIAPIAQFFSLSVDMFSGNSAKCILANMDGRTKVSLNLLPGVCYAFLLCLVYIAVTAYKSYKLKQEIDNSNQGDDEDIVMDDTLNTHNDKYSHALKHTMWNIILVIYAQITATLVKLTDCRPLGSRTIMFYQGSIDCYDWIHVICYVFLFGCFVFPFALMFILFRFRKKWGMGFLRRSFPSLVLNYRQNCWWFASFSLFRRFAIIFLSTLPAERSDVTSTFLAIVVGCIFAFHLLLQPFHWSINNYGETYVWFIALAISTVNIIDFSNITQDSDIEQLELLLTCLVFAIFIPIPILMIDFIKEKLPFTFHTSFDEEDESPVIKQFSHKDHTLIIRKKIKTEEKVIEFDKAHFEALRQKAISDDEKMKQFMKGLDPVQIIEQELDVWLTSTAALQGEQAGAVGNNAQTNGEHKSSPTISSDEKELQQHLDMDKITADMIQNEDVPIFTHTANDGQITPAQSPQPMSSDLSVNENSNTETKSKTDPQKVMADAWNSNQ